MTAARMTGIELSEIVRNWAIVLGGAGAVAIWRGWAASIQARASREDAALNQRNSATELFNRCVEQLGDDRIETRVNAILTLRRLSADFPDLGFPVFEVLSVAVQERASELDMLEMPADLREMARLLGDLS